MCNAPAWPQQFWKSCANGSNIVALRFGDQETAEMLGVAGSKFDKFQHQHATCNIQQRCVRLHGA